MTVGHLANVILLFFKAEKNPEIVSLSLSLIANQSHNTEILSVRGHISRAPFKRGFYFQTKFAVPLLQIFSWIGVPGQVRTYHLNL